MNYEPYVFVVIVVVTMCMYEAEESSILIITFTGFVIQIWTCIYVKDFCVV